MAAQWHLQSGLYHTSDARGIKDRLGIRQDVCPQMFRPAVYRQDLPCNIGSSVTEKKNGSVGDILNVTYSPKRIWKDVFRI